MIELILTNTLNSNPILDKLKSKLGAGKKHILFVPDRFSLSYQKATLEHLNIKGTFDIEVSSFPRLANKLLQNKKRLLDKQSEIMLLRKVIEESKDELLSFGKMGRSADFANDMYAVISQIRNSNISVEQMQNAVDGLPKRIANKTKDIIRIYHDYVQYIQEDYSDGTSKLQALCDLIYKGALNDYEVYISDFTSFSNIEYDIIKAIMVNALNTHICLVDSDGENSQVFPTDVKKRLFSLASEVGVTMDISYSQEKLTGDAEIIFKGLYSYGKVDGVRDGRTRILACKSISDEIKSLARTINYLVRRQGARYRDMAIVCCDFATYAPYIDSIFKAFDIPFYADIKQQLSSQALTKLVASAIRTVGEKFSQSSVLEFAKQPILGFDFDEVCIFDNYCCKYGVEYTRFLSPFNIGVGDCKDIAERIRIKIMELLAPLDLSGKYIKDHIRAVREFLQNSQASALVENLAKWQEQNGFGELAGITLQSQDKLNSIFDKCESMLGGNIADWEEFYGIIMTAVESVEMSNIPLYSDCVFIGETSQNRYAGIDYMFVIGAVAGKFPPEHSDTGIVSEREYYAWSKMNINVEPDCRRRNSKERLSTLMLLTRARKMLVVSYPTASANGEELTPSSTVEYLQDLLGILPSGEQSPDGGWDRAAFIDYVSSQDNILQEFLSLQTLAKDHAVNVSDTLEDILDILYTLCCQRYGQSYVDFLIGERSDEVQLEGMGNAMFNGSRTSVSQFEKYFNCPFLHFNANVLKLQRKEIAGLEVKDTGILLHAVMEQYFSIEDCADKSEQEIQNIVPKLFLSAVESKNDYAFLLDSKKNALTLQQLINQSIYVVKNLVANMQVTKFRPYKLEAAFGRRQDAILPGMEISSGVRNLSFEGVIDRIDTCQDKAIIVDYKSKSEIQFAPSNIFYGDRIQLFVYLNALRASGNITPQGVFYLLMNNRFVKKEDEAKRFIFHGFVNKDDVFDLDKGFAQNADFKSGVYPIKSKTNKDGEVIYSSQAKLGHVMSSKSFDDACDYVMKLTSKAAKEIEDGYIAKSPLNIKGEEQPGTCKYCDYKDLCARSKVYERSVKDISQQEFESLIGDEPQDINLQNIAGASSGEVLCKEDLSLPKEEK
ncbi:MAG: exodeoxyribonuclease V subunit gamma [Clostridia bacterium]|nr:exodeoxyribonuclease V subunit gamma [Clostridia bacterium]